MSFPAFSVRMHSDVGAGLNPGHAFRVAGVVLSRDVHTGAIGTPASASVRLRLHDAAGGWQRDLSAVATDATGRFSTIVPAAVTAGYRGSRPLDQQVALAVDAVSVQGRAGRAARRAGSAEVPLRTTARGLRVTNSFVSSVGWVTPGETYPFLVRILNPSAKKHTHVSVRLHAVSGMRIRAAKVLGGRHIAVHHGHITWRAGSLAAGTTAKPTTKTLVVT